MTDGNNDWGLGKLIKRKDEDLEGVRFSEMLRRLRMLTPNYSIVKSFVTIISADFL